MVLEVTSEPWLSHLRPIYISPRHIPHSFSAYNHPCINQSNMPGIYPNTPAIGLPPGGLINPGETSLQAAARRYHERKRRESTSSGELDPQPSPSEQLFEEPRRDSQGSRGSIGSEEMPRRRSSFSERWHEFKRHLP